MIHDRETLVWTPGEITTADGQGMPGTVDGSTQVVFEIDVHRDVEEGDWVTGDIRPLELHIWEDGRYIGGRPEFGEPMIHGDSSPIPSPSLVEQWLDTGVSVEKELQNLQARPCRPESS